MTKNIPALRFRSLTPLYDPLLKWVMREETFNYECVLALEETFHLTTVFGSLSMLQAGKGGLHV